MDIGEDFPGTVCFLGARDRNKIVPVATGFFARVSPHHGITYLVTAAHARRKYGEDGLYIMGRGRGGATVIEPLKDGAWREHETERTDVVVMELPESITSQISIVGIGTPAFITVAFKKERVVGVGHEVFILGLFEQASGKFLRNPVARFGRIALMPKEGIYTDLEDGKGPVPIEAHLVETLAWGGESGSPVFAYSTVGGPVALLGMLQGHLPHEAPIRFPKKTDRARQKAREDPPHAELNSGMALVVPARIIREILERDDFKEAREKHAEESKPTGPVGKADFAPIKGKKPRGPVPDRLKLEGSWEAAIGRATKKPRPEGGWPKRPTKRQRKEKP